MCVALARMARSILGPGATLLGKREAHGQAGKVQDNDWCSSQGAAFCATLDRIIGVNELQTNSRWGIQPNLQVMGACKYCDGSEISELPWSLNTSLSVRFPGAASTLA